MPNYVHIASPLHRACQKGDRFKWTAECEEAFRDIKHRLSSASILTFPQLDVPFILDNDVSDSGLGAVLSQVQCSKERLIAYAARALLKAERNYSTTRKELLALVWGAKHFETFLYGRRFLVRTDHSALPWLRNFKTLEARKGLVTLVSSRNIVRVSCTAMRMDCPAFPGTRVHRLT